jgi:hypothetical protein
MSAQAASRLEGLGFVKVFRYAAGKADWLAAGCRAKRRRRISRWRATWRGATCGQAVSANGRVT